MPRTPGERALSIFYELYTVHVSLSWQQLVPNHENPHPNLPSISGAPSTEGIWVYKRARVEERESESRSGIQSFIGVRFPTTPRNRFVV